MATITKTPQDIFGSGQQGDTFEIDASGSSFAIYNSDNERTTVMSLENDGGATFAISNAKRIIGIFLNRDEMSGTFLNASPDLSTFMAVQVLEESVKISYKDGDGTRTQTFIPNRDDSPIKGYE